jgi:Zn-dependent peptidase ImmA (M78 family)/DNA-binding XRE family transcriptional regulator
VLVPRSIDGSLEVYHEGAVVAKTRKTGRRRTRSNSDFAFITPAVLAWAITRSGLSHEQVASKINVRPEQIEAWETDPSVHPPMAKAEKLASVLQVPFGYFYLDSPPDSELPLPDMRKMNPKYRPTPSFLELLNGSLLKQDWYRDYLVELDEPELPFVGKYQTSNTITEIAEDIRQSLDIGPQSRRGVYRWEDYVGVLSKRAEGRRIIVLRTSVANNNNKRPISYQEVQGFAIADRVAPLIFVNSSDFHAAQVFTIAHELAHVWIGASAISNSSEGEDHSLNAIEAFCNAIATEVLVPAVEFKSLWTAPTDASIQKLARTFFVSSLVIIRRARELSLISWNVADSLRSQAVAVMRAKPTGQPSYYVTSMSRVGHLLADAVVSEVQRGNLILPHAGRLLDMNAHTVARFMASATGAESQ